MNQSAKSKVALLLSGLFAAVPVLTHAANLQLAANQPDAGTLLDTVRDKGYEPPKKPEPGIEVQQQAELAMHADTSTRFNVTAFHITGNTVFTEAELQTRIASSLGHELTLADLEKVAGEISQYYRSRGYFVARAYIPAQEIKGGVVQIAVLEGRVGKIDVRMTGSGKLTEDSVTKTVEGSIKPGDVIRERKLEKGLLLANDLANVSVDSTLVPGASVGTSDLVVDARRTGTFSGGLDYDNFGNKFTGESRVGASLNVGDRFGGTGTLRVMSSGTGLKYGRASYLEPVGNLGTKVGIAYSGMHYELGDAFAALNGYGKADIGSLFVIHPVVRGRNCNLYVQLGYDGKHLLDNAGGVQKDDKHSHVYSLGASGDSRDGLGGGGMNTYSLTYYSGSLDLDAQSQSLDVASAQTNGSFDKTGYSVSRTQRLSDTFALYAALSGQAASKNLDSSEKFVLGGANGVRSYPQGEATGDEGQILNIELRRDLGANQYGNFQLIGFYDVGHIELNKSPWAGWQGGNGGWSNSYNLSGAGLGLNFSRAGADSSGYSVKGYVATKLGTNPNAVNGMDSDGTNSKTRFWLQASKWF